MRRKTREEKIAQGTYRPDRDRTVPQFRAGATRPKFLTNRIARAEWNRVAPLLTEQGVLTEIDATLLASYCLLYAHWRESVESLARDGLVIIVSSQTRTGSTVKPVQNPALRNSLQLQKQMMATATKFGINPLDRPRIEVPPNDEGNPLQDFIDGVYDDAD